MCIGTGMGAAAVIEYEGWCNVDHHIMLYPISEMSFLTLIVNFDRYWLYQQVIWFHSSLVITLEHTVNGYVGLG